jgi:hypothetical protein
VVPNSTAHALNVLILFVYDLPLKFGCSAYETTQVVSRRVNFGDIGVNSASTCDRLEPDFKHGRKSLRSTCSPVP